MACLLLDTLTVPIGVSIKRTWDPDEIEAGQTRQKTSIHFQEDAIQYPVSSCLSILYDLY